MTIISPYLEFITVLDLGIGILPLEDIPKDPKESRLELGSCDSKKTKRIIISSYLEFISVLDLGIGTLLLKDIPKDPEELRFKIFFWDNRFWIL